jgi:hypothetical protein
LIGYEDCPPLAKTNGDARTNERFDGLPYDRWLKLRESTSKLDAMGWVYLFETLERLTSGQECAVSIGLGEAMAEMDRVVGGSQSKHPGKKWKTYSVAVHIAKILGHVGLFMRGKVSDHESGRHALAHSAARCLMALQLDLDEQKRR